MIQFIATILFSANSAFAGLGPLQDFDAYTGIYRSEDRQLTMILRKVQVQEGDLLNQAKYEYQVQLTDRKNSFVDTEFSLIPGTNGGIADDFIDGECDDPGCYDVDYTVSVTQENGLPKINLRIDWYRYDGGDEEEGNGHFFRSATRVFQGIEQPAVPEESLSSPALRELAYASAKYHIRWISSRGDYRIGASAGVSQFSVYKKAFTAGGELEALFVSTKTKYKNPEGETGPAECLTVLVKEDSWRPAYSDCTGGSFPERF